MKIGPIDVWQFLLILVEVAAVVALFSLVLAAAVMTMARWMDKNR